MIKRHHMKSMVTLLAGAVFVFLGMAFTDLPQPLHSGSALTSLTFETVRFKKESSGCAQDANHCARVIAEYPKVVDGPPAVVKMINDSIFHHVRYGLSVFATSEDKVFDDLRTIADRFIADYEGFADEQEEDYRVGWSIEMKGEVLYHSSQVVSIALDNFSYTGGAHPNAYKTLLNFDLVHHRPIQLEDIIADREGFRKLAESYFREYHQLRSSTDLNEAGFFWDKSFFLPANFAVKKGGLYLYYNNYEAAAYAVGATELLLPWEELKGLLKKGQNGIPPGRP